MFFIDNLNISCASIQGMFPAVFYSRLLPMGLHILSFKTSVTTLTFDLGKIFWNLMNHICNLRWVVGTGSVSKVVMQGNGVAWVIRLYFNSTLSFLQRKWLHQRQNYNSKSCLIPFIACGDIYLYRLRGRLLFISILIFLICYSAFFFFFFHLVEIEVRCRGK